MVRTVISAVERVAQIVAEVVAAKVAEKAAEKVREYLVDPVKLHFGYVFNSHNHVTDLLQIIDALGDARKEVVKLVEEATQQGDVIPSDVQEWLKATEGILLTRMNFDQDLRASEGRFNPWFRYNLGRRAKRQREDCDVKLQQAVSKRRRLTAAFPSRESILNQIMEALRNEQTSIVGVWGMGGVGKTTLALQVAKQAEVEKLFDKVVMASSISQTPIISDIQTELARTLGLTFREGQDRAVALMNSLKNQKKVLVILDDIWDKLDLGKIGIPYGDDHKGCKLLLTSREYDVVVTDMMATPHFQLRQLEAKEAWSLFKRTAGDSVELPELKATVEDIVRKCEGLPLAIVTIAKALKDKGEGIWKNALKELIMAKPTSIRGMSKNVYSCLELSYNNLEGDEVKSLFLLCGLVGGRLIYKDDLLFYAKGLNMFEGMYSMEDSANKLITLVGKLIASSLLLQAEEGENDSLFFEYPFVKMHDVVRDVARSIASKDPHCRYVVTEAVELREWERSRECRNYRGISLECEDQNELPRRLVCPELELFLLNSSFDPSGWREGTELRIPEEFFRGVTKLRGLHMSVASLRLSPSSHGFLSNLRTLCLIGGTLEDMTCIGEMKGLQVLSFASSDIVELPKEIGHLNDLRVLDLGYCYKLHMIPRNVISSLLGLECLNLRGCRKIEWGRDGESNNRACLSEVKNLPGLRTLEVDLLDPTLLPDDIGLDLVNLTRYKISIKDYSGQSQRVVSLPNNFSKNLIMQGVKSRVLKSFSNLFKTCQVVILEYLDGISNLVYELANESGFPQLEFLRIFRFGTIRHIVSSSVSSSQKWILPRDTFCRLDQLQLAFLPDLESVLDFHGSASIPIECFSKLSRLTLTDCEKLRCVVSLLMQHGEEVNLFPRLKILKLDDLPNLIGLYSTTTTEQSEVPVSILFSQKASYLALEKIYVRACPLHVLWHNQLPAHSFSKLKKLKVEYCNGLRNVFQISWVNALVQLEKLVFCHCKSLEEMVTNIEGDEDIGTDEDIEEVNFFPRLKMLELHDLPNLIGFYSTATPEHSEMPVPILFNQKASYLALENICVQECPLRVLWHNQLPAHSFSKLKELKIENCNELKNVLPVSLVKALVQLETLLIRHCESLEEIVANIEGDEDIGGNEDIEDEATFFPKLAHLQLKDLVLLKRFCSLEIKLRWPLLKELSVEGCGDQVRTVYEEIDLEGDIDAPSFFLVEKEAYPELETLKIFTMKGVVEIWRGQFSGFSFSKLRKLSIEDCHDISFVISRNMVQTLSNLEELWVESCDSVKEVIQLLDDEPTRDEICFSKLKSLRLNGLQNWKCFCYATCTIRFPSLEESWVGGLGHHLPTLWRDQFPADWFSQLKTLEVKGWHELHKAFPVSLVKAFVQLERLTIIQCESLEEIVANNALQDIEDDQATFFPKLVSLCLKNLGLLKRFCSQGIKFRWPLLNDLRVEGCDQVKIVFEEMGLEGEVDVPPLFLVEKEDFFDLCELVLQKLNGVVEIWRDQFSSMSFSKLRVLNVCECHRIPVVISKNMIQRLQNLEELQLFKCNSMEEVIQLLDDKSIICFSKLKILCLGELPNLKGFCSATCKFQFPSLEYVEIFDCRKMEFFCKGGFDITNDIVKEKISSVLPSNAGNASGASYESDESNIASTSQDPTA